MPGLPGTRTGPYRPYSVARPKGAEVWKVWRQKKDRVVLMLNTEDNLVHKNDIDPFNECTIVRMRGEERRLENICILLDDLIGQLF